MKPVRLLHAAALGAALFTAGCYLIPRATPTPIRTRTTPDDPQRPASTLVVFLPGRGGSMADFAGKGFDSIMRQAGVHADVVAVDAHLGYYYRRTIIERLTTDVLVPARQRGYRRIVLVGISLGGLGALLNEREHPGAVDAVVLLSPYLGDRQALFRQIVAAGGPAAWAAGRPARTGEVDEQLWTFLGLHVADLPPTWLLYGHADPLSQGHQLLAPMLPATRVTAVAGAHDWPTWRALWRIVCEQSEVFAAEKRLPW